MPNWCVNRVTFRGRAQDIERLVKLVESKDSLFDFQQVIPRPANVTDWYHWNLTCWGTKWNVTDVRRRLEVDSAVEQLARVEVGQEPQGAATYDFDTAWNEPGPVIDALAKMFPDLRVEHCYIEEGCAFSGLTTYVKGEVESSETEADGESIYFLSDWHKQFGPDPGEAEPEEGSQER